MSQSRSGLDGGFGAGHQIGMGLIYKIFRTDEMEQFRHQGVTAGAQIDIQDGYIHFSTAEQLEATADKYFADAHSLTILGLNSDQLGEELKWEKARGGALFPHLYRDLEFRDIVFQCQVNVDQPGRSLTDAIAGHLDPTRKQFNTFKSLDRDGPIDMLNLVRLRSFAAYPPGHRSEGDQLTGAEAYLHYGAATAPVLERVGGKIAWRGAFQAMLIGPATDTWDHIFIASYPSAHAFLAMVTDPDYQKAVVHRQAAVKTSRLIRCGPTEAGASFA